MSFSSESQDLKIGGYFKLINYHLINYPSGAEIPPIVAKGSLIFP